MSFMARSPTSGKDASGGVGIGDDRPEEKGSKSGWKTWKNPQKPGEKHGKTFKNRVKNIQNPSKTRWKTWQNCQTPGKKKLWSQPLHIQSLSKCYSDAWVYFRGRTSKKRLKSWCFLRWLVAYSRFLYFSPVTVWVFPHKGGCCEAANLLLRVRCKYVWIGPEKPFIFSFLGLN